MRGWKLKVERMVFERVEVERVTVEGVEIVRVEVEKVKNERVEVESMEVKRVKNQVKHFHHVTFLTILQSLLPSATHGDHRQNFHFRDLN